MKILGHGLAVLAHTATVDPCLPVILWDVCCCSALVRILTYVGVLLTSSSRVLGPSFLKHHHTGHRVPVFCSVWVQGSLRDDPFLQQGGPFSEGLNAPCFTKSHFVVVVVVVTQLKPNKQFLHTMTSHLELAEGAICLSNPQLETSRFARLSSH